MIMYLRFHCDLIFKHQIIDKLNILRQLISIIVTFGKLFHVTKSKLPSCEDALDCARELWPPVLLWPVCSLLEFCCSEDECVPSVAPLPTLSMLRPSLPSPLMNRSKFSWYFVYMQIVYFYKYVNYSNHLQELYLLLLLLLLWWDDWWCPEDVFEPEVSRFWFLNFSSRLHFARRFENQT